MPAPVISAAGRAALHALTRAAAAYARQRAASGIWRWKRELALALGGATFMTVSLCAGIGAALQSSTLPWPVSVPQAGREANGWIAGGWRVSSSYGWRRDPFNPARQEFHDGVDLAGPPFCLHCRIPALFDAQVRYLGWDPYRDRSQPADKTDGGIVVELNTLPDEQRGIREGELVATYAHLAPYRLLVQLQGRIDDPWRRAEYLPYAEYRELGDRMLPVPDDGALAIACRSNRSERLPEFVAQRSGPASFVFLYDKPIVAPAMCSVTMSWPQHADGWSGWTPDEPSGPQPGTAVHEFRTPMEQMVEAGDVALRFRAHLTPPAPPPTPSAYPAPSHPGPAYPAPLAQRGAGTHSSAIPTPEFRHEVVAPAGCASDTRAVICRWSLGVLEFLQPDGRAAIRDGTAAETGPSEPAAASLGTAVLHRSLQPQEQHCGVVQLQQVPARARDPRMTPDAAAAWHRADALITAALGYAWLRDYASDIMRPVTHVPTKDNQILESWHKTGRAVDVPQSGRRGRRLVQEGAYQRLYIDGVDITALMVRAGFTRIPSNPAREEWWHFEFQGGLSWQGAMAQLYPLDTLKRLYRWLDWSSFACQDEDGAYPAPGDGPNEHQEPYPTCTQGVPSWSLAYEELPGCGPPLTWSSEIQMLDHVIGNVGLTGSTTAPHLHLGLRQRSGTDRYGSYQAVNVCAPHWLPDELRGKTAEEVSHTVYVTWRADCYSETVDPLDFLPRAHAGEPLPLATAAPLDGAPAQLPPPGTDGALLRPVASGEPIPGEYWSPFGRWGRFGGGGVLAWLRALLCGLLGDWDVMCESA